MRPSQLHGGEEIGHGGRVIKEIIEKIHIGNDEVKAKRVGALVELGRAGELRDHGLWPDGSHGRPCGGAIRTAGVDYAHVTVPRGRHPLTFPDQGLGRGHSQFGCHDVGKQDVQYGDLW